ncbi:oxidoreductase [Asanoa sp. NPDC049573]|uniref:oxidoreductase n=1 Tax=Asanoa sp. NPDC049573 TaxID=3155396 RepID=UPI0034315286
MDWSIGDLRPKVALVTGANTGIGRVTAEVLAAHGATVVLACRDVDKAARAAAAIRGRGGAAHPLHLDLADLTSVRAAAGAFRDAYPRLDLLVNNAGVMMPPYSRTADGFELQFGVNHLGHFALTGLLLDRLLATAASRVVTVSSNGHHRGVLDFADLQSEKRYEPLTAYAQSKLANLLFAHALQRRLAGTGTASLAAHPGAARTELMRHSPWHFRFVVSRRTKWLFSWLIQDEDRAALPTLRAATDPRARGGDYFGPSGWREFTGRRAVPVAASPASHDLELQERLWAESERLTGVRFEVVKGGVPS